ncbi:hypothetical protein WR25_15321 [Diploscapter pachys]|uniref:phosphoglucomutase (alpha-D-glucose-1,6-bisphosphate-dependent) n=1 Tax=Diploscapter pachys TaxID=2018661 RepID=A0A2A2KKZ8_9BILA|nr:hypothetical protein WR25_15321 [Diploscapter pachys]
MSLSVTVVPTKPFKDQKPGTSGLRKKVPEFQQQHYTENFIQAVLDGGLGDRKNGAVLVVGGDGRFLCMEAANVIIKLAAANGVSRLIVGQNAFFSTPAVSALIRKGFEGRKIDGGIILTASHNPGGPRGDFGIKFNCDNGGPAPDGVTNRIYEITTKISEYRIVNDLQCDFTQIGRYEFNVEGRNFVVDVVDPVEDYAKLMQQIFDFDKIRQLLSGKLTGSRFKVLLDSMHGATGPYVSTILCDHLGAASEDMLRTVPKPDFGNGHPDPNLTYAKALVDRLKQGDHDFGAAFDGDGDRNMILGRNGFFVTPSDSLAVIADNIEAIPYFRQIFETPTGWKYFGNLMDAGRMCLCGEESFGTGSDHIREKDGVWAMLAWLQILAERQTSVQNLVQMHWKKYGRNVFTRYDYENVDGSGANLLMNFLEAQMPAFIGRELSANNVKYTVASADNFQYKDPIDGSVATKQGLRFLFTDGSRFVFRLSGTGSAGATIRLYVDSYIPPGDSGRLFMDSQDLLKPLILVALDLSKMEQFTGRKNPTVIT